MVNLNRKMMKRSIVKDNKRNLRILFFILFFCVLANFSFGQTNIYIDPSSASSSQDGTLANPFKSFDAVNSFISGTTYLVKRGTTMNISKKIFVRPANITIKAYGTGNRPVIISAVSSKDKILDISLTSNFTIRDIELTAKDTALTVINIQGSPNTRVVNCKLHKAMYGLRNIDSRNKVYIDSVEIFNIQQDGIYFNGADSVIIKNSHIHHINQAWFKSPTEQGSYGDAIQLDAAKYFYVGNNILDRSDTGNKFCFITGSGPCPGSVFEKNKCYGSPTLGAHMYNINTQGLIIRYNLFSGGSRSIFGTGLNSKVYYNIFNNVSVSVFGQITRVKQEFYNNVFANCNVVLSSWNDTLYVKNNIFYKVTKPFESNFLTEDHNIFYQTGLTLKSFVVSSLSKIGDPLFVDVANNNFNLKAGSPAINSGVNLSLPKLDYGGAVIPGSAIPSIGAYQSGNGIALPVPSGVITACVAAKATYTTTGVANATTYTWKVSPSNAGTVTSSGKTATIAWSSSYSGVANVSYDVAGSNNFTGVSPSLAVTVSGIPSVPNKPGSTAILPQGSQKITYSTNSIANAVSYNWSITPSDAGTFEGKSNTAVLTQSSTFTGIANITVRAVSTCGTSAWSSPLPVTVNSSTAGMSRPIGDEKPCQGRQITYKAGSTSQNSNYVWKIIPAEAGKVLTNGNTATVLWNQLYSGNAAIYYETSGTTRSMSQQLNVEVGAFPLKPETPLGDTAVTSGQQQFLTYSIGSINDASEYKWNISPQDAGTLSIRDNYADLNINKDYSGTILLSVKVANACGMSVDSKPISINVKGKKYIIPSFFSPNGDGKDDVWNIPALTDHPDAEVKIFDISGRHVKTFYGSDLAWDGTINGAVARAGIYVYSIDFKGSPGIMNGKVLLMR